MRIVVWMSGVEKNDDVGWPFVREMMVGTVVVLEVGEVYTDEGL